MTEYYTWTKGDTKAQAMLDAINNHTALPSVGVNAATGLPQPDKQMTTKWADGLTEWTDGRVGFQRIPERVLDRLGIDQAERDAMLGAYEPTIVDGDTLPLTVEQ